MSTRADATPRPNALTTLLVYALAAVLLLGASAYLYKGFRLLGAAGDDPQDLRRRWRDQHYVLKGQNPYEVLYATLNDPAAPRGVPAGPRTAVDPKIGTPIDAGYPPWAFFTGIALFWPDWPAAAWYWAALNAAALAVSVLWLRQADGPRPAATTTLLIAAWLAMSSLCTTIQFGNIGVVIFALLAGILYADRRGSWVIAGLLLGLAMFKPNITVPFAAALLLTGRWKAVSVGVAYCVLASLAVWAITGTDPLLMTRQMLYSGRLYMTEGASSILIAVKLGASPAAALGLTALVVLAAGAALHLLCRSRPLLFHFAVAAVVCRLWTYHGTYDNLILGFLLATLILQYTSRRPLPPLLRYALLTAIAAVGVSLWLPGSMVLSDERHFAQFVVWTAAVVPLVLARRALVRSDNVPPTGHDAGAKMEIPLSVA